MTSSRVYKSVCQLFVSVWDLLSPSTNRPQAPRRGSRTVPRLVSGNFSPRQPAFTTMSSENYTVSTKEYVDRAIQTATPSRLVTATESKAGLLHSPFRDITSAVCNESSEMSFSASPSQFSNAYSHSLSHSSPPSLGVTTQRTLKPHLPRNRPSQSQNEMGRIVSLPETDPLFSAKMELKSTSVRIVSMPEQRPSSGYLLDASMSTDGVNSSMYSGDSLISSGDDDRSGIYLPRFGQGIPHTPSPSSSPDSVVIIENNGELSEAFLRSSKNIEEREPESPLQNTQYDDEGWITWAKSPPRPIPALHGPLSLPYARCPSGAEGTIIEEPDNLPRMIWGLGEGGQSPPPFPFQPLKCTISSYEQEPSHLLQSQPPLHSQVDSRSNELDIRSRKPRVEYIDAQYPRSDYDDAIVLENLLQEQQASRNIWDTGYDLALENLAGLTLNDALRMQNVREDLQSNRRLSVLEDYSGFARAQHTLPKSNASHVNNSVDHLRSVPTMRVSSHPALGSALPQILIKPRSPPPFSSQRLSAMEIAQQYRQQQLHRQQGSLLPTPPNSSSPLWSSDFSPYEDTLLSPNWASSHVNGRSVAALSNQPLSSAEASHELRRLVYERMGLSADISASLAPPAQIQSSARLQPAVRNITSVSSSETLVNYLGGHDAVYSTTASPQRPGPPPNTPRSRTVSQEQPTRRYQPYYAKAPISPTSPETHHRSLSYQQPRSIPLARLIQRRLSAVPEEDGNSTVRGRSPSPPLPSMHDTGMLRARHHTVAVGVPTRNWSSSSQRRSGTGSGSFQYARTVDQPQAVLTMPSKATAEMPKAELYVEPAPGGRHLQVKTKLPPPTLSRNGSDVQEVRVRPQSGAVISSVGLRAVEERSNGNRDSQKENGGRGGIGRKRGRGRGRRAFNEPSSLAKTHV
ncbi:hypothetical protein EW146_g203 [Bondarzewia mesenterica]|uniref:Uncharacterized protein n=1 Tax=Bondarzewia mesenterica TaxID=1095465 RepID=A0A4S4M9B4_9AGAM|nr:hypothetical protein EW146_g203 [Bondarzewia mesenterica]